MILTFDCATCTGWCAGDGASVPILGSVNMPSGGEIGPFLDYWHRWLQQHLDDIKPSVIVFEAPFMHSNMNGTTSRKLISLAGVLEMVAQSRKIPIEETSPSHVKLVLTGSGKSPKPDMILCARKCGVRPRNADEADAFGIWLCAVHHHARQHQPMWDKKLYAGKGLL